MLERVLHIHDETICSAGQVGIYHRAKIFPAHGGRLPVESLQPIRDRRIGKGIVEYIAVYRQPVNLMGDMIGAVGSGVNPNTVGFEVWNGDLQASYLFDGHVDIHFCYALISRNVQIPFRGPFTEGVAGGHAGQAVGQAVMDRGNLFVCDQFFCRQHIDSVAAEDPHVPLIALIKVKIVGIREVLYRCHPVIRCHIRDGIARDKPEEVSGLIAFDLHDDAG